jgi:hypothetical protein
MKWESLLKCSLRLYCSFSTPVGFWSRLCLWNIAKG